VHPATTQLGDDPHPVRIRHRREHGKQSFLAGQRRLLVLELFRFVFHLSGGTYR
jgi:hypothetical protein